MISEEKMVHVLHLMLTGLKKEGFVEFPREEEAVREARKASLAYLKQFQNLAENVRKRILSMKNPPQEHTMQWENLYRKYMEEELAKLGS